MKEKLRELKWLNIFIRDVFLILVVGGLHYMTNFNSKTVWLITGMLLVYVSWQLSDYIKHKRRLTNGKLGKLN